MLFPVYCEPVKSGESECVLVMNCCVYTNCVGAKFHRDKTSLFAKTLFVIE